MIEIFLQASKAIGLVGVRKEQLDGEWERESLGLKIIRRVSLSSASRRTISPVIADRIIWGESVNFRAGDCPSTIPDPFELPRSTPSVMQTILLDKVVEDLM